MNGAILDKSLSSYYEMVKFILSLIRILHLWRRSIVSNVFFRDNAGIRDNGNEINASAKSCIPAMNIGRSWDEAITSWSLI